MRFRGQDATGPGFWGRLRAGTKNERWRSSRRRRRRRTLLPLRREAPAFSSARHDWCLPRADCRLRPGDAWPLRSTGGRRPDACRFSSARRTFRVECTSSACRPPTRLACFPCTNNEGSSDDLGCAADGGRVFKELKRPVPLSYALVSLLSGPPLVPGRTHTHFSST